MGRKKIKKKKTIIALRINQILHSRLLNHCLTVHDNKYYYLSNLIARVGDDSRNIGERSEVKLSDVHFIAYGNRA